MTERSNAETARHPKKLLMGKQPPTPDIHADTPLLKPRSLRARVPLLKSPNAWTNYLVIIRMQLSVSLFSPWSSRF